MSEQVQHVTDNDFEAEVLQADQPVLVDFWAEWCGPCRALAPMIDELAGEYAGRVKFVKLNIDDNPKSAVQFNVRSIPTLLLFKDGKVEATEIGAKPKGAFTSMLDKVA